MQQHSDHQLGRRRAGARDQFGHRCQVGHQRDRGTVDDRVEPDLDDAAGRTLRRQLGRLEAEEHLRVITAAGADTRQIGDDVDAVAPQLSGRSDARQQQQVRRHDRAGTQHDLVARRRSRSEPERSTSTPTARLPAITTRRAVTLLSIVRLARLRFGEMYANAALTLIPSTTLRGRRPQPGAPGAFLSGSSGKPSSAHAATNARLSGCRRRTLDRDTGTGPPLPWYGASGKSRSSSSRLRNGSTSANDHASLPSAAQPSKSAAVARTNTPRIDRARSAHHLAARHRGDFATRSNERRTPSWRRALRPRRPSPRRRADRTDRRSRSSRSAAGLEQQHRAVGVLAEPSGQRAPGRAGTDDDDVVVAGNRQDVDGRPCN